MINKAIAPLMLLASLLIFSCGKEDPQDENITLSQTAVEVNYEETFRLDATFIRDGYSPSGFIWESANPNIASVRNDGTITGMRVGKTIVTVYTADRLFSADCEVTVNPTNLLYREPLFDFGQNKAYIRANESRSFLGEDDESLAFRGENNSILGVVYLFANTQYEVSYAVLNLNTEAEFLNLIDFLEQRYELLGFDGEFLIFENEDVLVGLTEDEDGVFVVYLQNDDPAGAGNRVDKLRKATNTSIWKSLN